MTDIVELTIPVKADLVVLARLTAATVASRADFDVEEIEDLRLAVDELCISVIQDSLEGRLDLHVQSGQRCDRSVLPVRRCFSWYGGSFGRIIGRAFCADPRRLGR